VKAGPAAVAAAAAVLVVAAAARAHPGHLDPLVVPDVPGAAAVAGRFFLLGVEHIATGFDHLLFLLGVLVVAPSVRRAAALVSGFTVAHSVTLALAAVGLVVPPARWVEATIAATLVWVAVENLFRAEPRGRPLVVFAFGLVHGFGFAGALGDLGLPRAAFLEGLVSFNLGVEAGQLAVVLTLAPALLAIRRAPERAARLVPVGSAVVGGFGAYWLVERLLGG
jgi:hypothetical protein